MDPDLRKGSLEVCFLGSCRDFEQEPERFDERGIVDCFTKGAVSRPFDGIGDIARPTYRVRQEA